MQAIKPLFMMSPISIAQFLEPGQLEFDIMIMDEASQVPAEDALGAVARAKQIVVVGDSKQLPPTRFFNKVMDDSPLGEDDETFNTGDIDCVIALGAAGAGVYLIFPLEHPPALAGGPFTRNQVTSAAKSGVTA